MTAPGLGGLMRDPDQAAASMQAWADGLAAKAERYRAAQERTEEIRLSSANTDGSVRVTVRADGSVTDLELSGRARTMPLDELSAQILTTMRRAQAGIAGQVAEVLTEEIGDDEDPQTRSLMLDNLRTRFPDPDPDPDSDETEAEDAAPPDADEGSAGDAEADDNNPW